MMFNQNMFLWSLTLAAMTTGCSKTDKTDETTPGAGGTAAKELAEVASVGDLNLASSFNVTLPAALEGSSAALRLAGGKRSHEACEIGRSVKEVTQRLGQVGSFFCHLDVESDKITFGTKYKITSGGEEFGRIWVDNSQAASGKIAVYMCQPDGNGVVRLKEKIEITGVSDSGAAGTIADLGSEGDQSWASAIEFDAGFSTAGAVTIEAKDHYQDSSETGGEFKRHVLLNLVESGVSDAILASSGSWQGSEFAQRGKAMFNGEVGDALFFDQGKYMDQTYEWTHTSYFDADGFVVDDPSMYDAFLDDGELHIAAADLPEFLSASFSPDAPDGWDCSTDEDIELDPESAAHQACDQDRDHDAVDCWGEDFEQGGDAE